jgi:hypothetical protein
LAYKVAVFGPYLVALSLVVLAFVLGAYWLLAAVAFPFVAILLTGPHFPMKTNAIPGAVIPLCIGLASTSAVTTLFFTGYAVCHLLVASFRHIYTHVLFQRAFGLESVFILLYTSGHILVSDRRLKRCIRPKKADHILVGATGNTGDGEQQEV